MKNDVKAKRDMFKIPYMPKPPEPKRETNMRFDYLKPGKQSLKIADL